MLFCFLHFKEIINSQERHTNQFLMDECQDILPNRHQHISLVTLKNPLKRKSHALKYYISTKLSEDKHSSEDDVGQI